MCVYAFFYIYRMKRLGMRTRLFSLNHNLWLSSPCLLPDPLPKCASTQYRGRGPAGRIVPARVTACLRNWAMAQMFGNIFAVNSIDVFCFPVLSCWFPIEGKIDKGPINSVTFTL